MDVISGSFSANGQTSDWFPPTRPFRIDLSGGVCTCAYDVSYDEGATYNTDTIGGTLTTLTAPCNEGGFEEPLGVHVRLRVTSYSSGPVTWKFIQ